MRRAFSLAETMVATFILFSTLVIFAALVDTAMRYYAQVEKRNQAASVADRKMEEIRAWSRQVSSGVSNFDGGSWASFNGPTTDAYYPDMQVSVDTLALEPRSPTRQLESEFNPDHVVINGGLRAIQVTVDWSDAIDTNRQLVVMYYLSAPRRANLPLSVEVGPSTGQPNPVPDGTTVAFACQAYDTDHNSVDGLTYSWEVVPEPPTPGSAYVLQNRSGRTAQLTNAIYADESATITPPVGNRTCRLRVVTRYFGVEYAGVSPVVTLAPP